MARNHVIRGAVVVCLLTAAATQAVRASTPAPTSVVISGSTLFEPFFTAPGSNNDFVDVNGDGIYGYNPNGGINPTDPPFVQTIAPVITAGSIDSNGNITYPSSPNDTGESEAPALSVQYRGTGSVGGLEELLSSQSGNLALQPASTGRINSYQVIANGVSTGTWATGAGGFPAGAATTSVDAAVLDVTAIWGTQASAGTTAWNKKPTQPGYGTNALASNTGYTNQLASLTVNGTTFNLNTASPNAQTLYNTPVASVPINFIANPGTGLTQIKTSELQQLYVTGRMPNGENLHATTRSILSGTRNGAMNSIGVDPSYGVGDNIGADATGGNFGKLGSTFSPTNADGSGDLEAIMNNSRLSVGYDGSDRATSKNGGKWGSLQVMFDTEGGTSYVTPTVSAMLNNSDPNTGWRIFGNETFVTVGDPNATAVGTYPGDGNPAMANAAAAAYIRNITESVANYVHAPTSNSNLFMPSQVIVNNFIPAAAPAYIQSATDGASWIPNPNFDAGVQADALTKGGYNAPLAGSEGAGYVPQRITNASGYSDGSTNGFYVNPDTGRYTISSSMQLNDRNTISGDFNGSGVRDLNQIPQMMAAYANPRAWSLANFGTGSTGTTGMTKDYAIPEIIGDFVGDGNFSALDVRYYADGLAVDSTTGTVNRKAAFTAVDNNWTIATTGHPAGNFFNTTLATGKPYAAGDSRGDIFGSAQGPTPGDAPTGSDGVVNAQDIDYVISQIKAATGQTSVQPTNGTDPNLDVNGAFATLLTRAASNPLVNVRADFSADMTGDGMINANDLTDLVQNVLGTQFGDANLDGTVGSTDLATVLNNFGQSGLGWAGGNFDGAATIDLTDLADVLNNYGFSPSGGAVVVSTPVPEPASLAMLGVAGVLILNRRRRSC